MRRIIERLKADIEMQIRYLRHCYDVVNDYCIAAVRKSAVRIFVAIEYSKTPVVSEGMWPSKDIGGDIVGYHTEQRMRASLSI